MLPLSYTEFLHTIETLSGTNKCLKNEFLGKVTQGLVMKGISINCSSILLY